jgi:hypothetical protein
MLENMLNGPAFLLFCEKWDENVRTLQEKINDTKTSDEETRQLKHVREYLVNTKHPRKVLQTMIRSL